MNKLTGQAATVAGKYVIKASGASAEKEGPKRGLQAEINKIEAIRKVIGTKNIDTKELMRIRTSLNTLTQMIDQRLQNG